MVFAIKWLRLESYEFADDCIHFLKAIAKLFPPNFFFAVGLFILPLYPKVVGEEQLKGNLVSNYTGSPQGHNVFI
jgi:hypothetical protein